MPDVVIPSTINGLPVTEIEGSAFANDTALMNMTLSEGVKKIGTFAFYNSGINQVKLPSTIESIGMYAFAMSEELESFTWPASSEVMDRGVFCGDIALSSLILPEGLTEISNNALENCSSLSEVIIPDTVESVGEEAFLGMDRLTTLFLGTGLRSLAVTALDGCTALTAIYAADGNTHYQSADGILYYTDMSGIVRYPAGLKNESYTVNPSAIIVEAHAFKEADDLREVNLPTGLLQIGEDAFKDCAALFSIDLPDSVTGIGDEAFEGCTALTLLDVPDMVNSIGSDAFSYGITIIGGAGSYIENYAAINALNFRLRDQDIIPVQEIVPDKESLTLLTGVGYKLGLEVFPSNTTDSIIWSTSNRDILRVNDGYIRPLTAGKAEILIQAGDIEMTVPVEVVDSPIEIVSGEACVYSDQTLQLFFKNLTDNVQISSVTWTADGANITTDGRLSVTRTGQAVVYAAASKGKAAEERVMCFNLGDAMSLPVSLEVVEEEAFCGMTAIKNVIIPDNSVATIESRAFADCSALTYVYVPDSVDYIDNSAFENSTNVIIVCHSGSTAESYAIANKMNVIVLG